MAAMLSALLLAAIAVGCGANSKTALSSDRSNGDRTESSDDRATDDTGSQASDRDSNAADTAASSDDGVEPAPNSGAPSPETQTPAPDGGSPLPEPGDMPGPGEGGTGTPGGSVDNGIPLDTTMPFDVGREWVLATNYADFATVDRLSCRADAIAVQNGEPHQATFAALRQYVATGFTPRDDMVGYLQVSRLNVATGELADGQIPMILESDGGKVCFYPQYL